MLATDPDRIARLAYQSALRVPMGQLARAITDAEGDVVRAQDALDRATLRLAHAEARLDALRAVA